MQTPENAQVAPAAATPAGFGWADIAADAKSCFAVFARFGMGFSPELIAPHDGSCHDDLAEPARACASHACVSRAAGLSMQAGAPAHTASRAP